MKTVISISEVRKRLSGEAAARRLELRKRSGIKGGKHPAEAVSENIKEYLYGKKGSR